MVVDSFLFNNELDLLEIRLNVLDNKVDRFVLVEATETFTGRDKPLHYAENRERFAKWNHKILHYVVDGFPNDVELFDMAMKSPNTGAKEHFWVREFYQKESMIRALSFCEDDDLVFVSDLDEIWNPELEYANDRTYRPRQVAYHYFLNNRSDQDISGWVGTRCGPFSEVRRHGINHFRTEAFNPSVMLEDGGWHFTNVGDEAFIRKKMADYSHQEHNDERFLSRIGESISGNADFLGRGFRLWKDESGLPDYILNNREKWKRHLL